MRGLYRAALIVAGVFATAFATLPDATAAGAKEARRNEASVQIAGPGQVHPNSSCTWSALVTDISGPYTFWWGSSSGDQGTGQNFTTYATFPGMVIWVTVTGSDGEAYQERTIGVSPNGEQCF